MAGVSGKYRLDERLGGGGMAEVFRGWTVGAEGFSRKVAIKRVLPGYSDNEAFARMFVSEARLSSLLVHPNIVSVLDFDRDVDARLFLVMELVDGKDLDALLATGLIPFPVLVFVIAEVLRGLGYAHDLPVGSETRGVVHRDVSPHNVLLSWEGAVKVSDFGIAKARAASEATASVFIKGKPAYMSPEQANGQPLDGRSDLFAVGIMMWEMLIGRRLFTGEDTRATLAAVLFGQIPRPRSLRPEVPKDVERVVMRLLERDLGARYATAEQALHDLLECDDSPKAGREALIALLHERFPTAIPPRYSAQRARQSGNSPVVPSGTPSGNLAAATRATDPAQQRPAAAMPSLGALMNAPTGTLQAAPGRRRGLKLAAVGIVTVVSAIGAFAIVSATRTPSPTEARPPGTVPPRDAPPPDAAPLDAPIPDAPAPVDAMLPAPDASLERKERTPVRTVEKRFGKLRVTSSSNIVTIFVDGVAKGDSPREITLPIGRYTLVLRNDAAGIRHQQPIKIQENKTTPVDYVKP